MYTHLQVQPTQRRMEFDGALVLELWLTLGLTAYSSAKSTMDDWSRGKLWFESLPLSGLARFICQSSA